MASARRTFSLRFYDDLTPRVLRVIAAARKISMNELIGEMIARELPREVERVESDLAGTLDALRAYKGTFDEDWAAFAKAEGALEDPVKAERVETASDPLGVNAVFA
jgi:hypothetical protein